MPSAGWFPDPHDGTQLRYWDGQQWTDATSAFPSTASAPPPSSAERFGQAPAIAASKGAWRRQAGPLPVWAWVIGGVLVLGLIGALTSRRPERVSPVAAPSGTTSTASPAATSPSEAASGPTGTSPTAPPSTTASTTAAPVTEPPVAPPSAVMPDVICMNLQQAQDLIQTKGVFFSRSHDATGAGRMQVLDSNWVVVEQSPAAGAVIGEGDADLGVVKYGETSQC